MPAPNEVWECILGPIPPKGAVVDVQTAPIVGHEQGNSRPVIVVATFPTHNIATVIPVTNGADDIASSATVVPIGPVTLSPNGQVNGKALIHQIRSVSYDRLDSRRGRIVDNVLLARLRNALRVYLKIS